MRNIAESTDLPARRRPEEGGQSSVDILSRVNELLDRKLYEATILSEMGRVARSLSRGDETFTSVMALVGRVVDFSLAALAFVEGDDLEVFLMQHRQLAPTVVDEMKARLRDAVLQGRSGAGLGRVQARLFTPAAGLSGPEERTLGGFAAMAVSTGERLVGIMALGGRHVTRMSPDGDAFMQQVASQAYIVMQNSRLFERVQQTAIRDSLTELYNHRHSIELVQQEVARVGRYNAEGVSVLMVDVDHFKRVNDQLGHLAGDSVLRDLARLLREAVRNVDWVGRYGGEEFVLILPQTRYEEARQTAERLRQEVELHSFKAGERMTHMTVSVGVATYPSDKSDSAATLLREADLALYRAKEAGRNRVM